MTGHMMKLLSDGELRSSYVLTPAYVN